MREKSENKKPRCLHIEYWSEIYCNACTIKRLYCDRQETPCKAVVEISEVFFEEHFSTRLIWRSNPAEITLSTFLKWNFQSREFVANFPDNEICRWVSELMVGRLSHTCDVVNIVVNAQVDVDITRQVHDRLAGTENEKYVYQIFILISAP